MPTLLEEARDADLLVVGHRCRGPWCTALLGSVALSAVLHAPCPVTVVPALVAAAPCAAEEPATPWTMKSTSEDHRADREHRLAQGRLGNG